MRKTFMNIAKQVNEKRAKQQRNNATKDAVSKVAKQSVKIGISAFALLILSTVAYGYWRSNSTPEIARVVAAQPSDAEKALKLAQSAITSFRENPSDFEKICAHIDRMARPDIKNLLSNLKSEPLFNKASVSCPKSDAGTFYVQLPLDGGGRIYMSMRILDGNMALVNISPN